MEDPNPPGEAKNEYSGEAQNVIQAANIHGDIYLQGVERTPGVQLDASDLDAALEEFAQIEQRQADSFSTVVAYQRLTTGLLSFSSRLQDAVYRLTSERDMLREGLRVTNAEVQQLRSNERTLRDVQGRLSTAEDLQRETEHRLAKAREQLSQAERLRDEAIRQADAARDKLAAAEYGTASPPKAAGADTLQGNIQQLDVPTDLMGNSDQAAARAVLGKVDGLLEEGGERLETLEEDLIAPRRTRRTTSQHPDPPENEQAPSSGWRTIVREKLGDKNVAQPQAGSSTTASKSVRWSPPSVELKQTSKEEARKYKKGRKTVYVAGLALLVALGGGAWYYNRDRAITRDTKLITRDHVADGRIFTQRYASTSRGTFHTLEYFSFSTGQRPDLVFQVPQLKRSWLTPQGATRKVYLSSFLEYEWDGSSTMEPCHPATTIRWQINEKSGRFRIADILKFTDMEIYGSTITVIVQLDAPRPCGGIFRLTDPKVSNWQQYSSSVTTVRKQ